MIRFRVGLGHAGNFPCFPLESGRWEVSSEAEDGKRKSGSRDLKDFFKISALASVETSHRPLPAREVSTVSQAPVFRFPRSRFRGIRGCTPGRRGLATREKEFGVALSTACAAWEANTNSLSEERKRLRGRKACPAEEILGRKRKQSTPTRGAQLFAAYFPCGKGKTKLLLNFHKLCSLRSLFKFQKEGGASSLPLHSFFVKW